MAPVYLVIVVSALLLQRVLGLYNPPPSNCTYAPKPSAAVCGANGTVAHSHDLGAPQQVTSLDNCVYLCYRRESLNKDKRGCRGFIFNSQTGLCQLYARQAHSFISNSSSSDVVYDLRCFRCPARCPVPLEENLLDNGDFEASAEYLGPWTSTGQFSKKNAGIISPGHNSQYAYHYNGTMKQSNSARLSQVINYFPCDLGVAYTLQFDFKITSVEAANSSKGATSASFTVAWTKVFYPFFAQGGTYSFHARGGTRGKWKTVQAAYTNVDREITFSLDSYNPGSPVADNFYIDNVSIVAIGHNLTVQPGTPELFQNAGFETGRLKPWHLSGTEGQAEHSITSPGISGSYALMINITSNFARRYLRQEVQTVPGSRYFFSGDFIIDSDFGDKYPTELIVNFGHAGSYFSASFKTIPQSQSTRHYESQFIAQSERTMVTIDLGAYLSTDLTLDNFSIKELS